MLGRQETEGVLGKSRKAGFTGFGVSSSAKEHELCFSDGWPFRVSEMTVMTTSPVFSHSEKVGGAGLRLLHYCHRQHRPTEVDAVTMNS